MRQAGIERHRPGPVEREHARQSGEGRRRSYGVASAGQPGDREPSSRAAREAHGGDQPAIPFGRLGVDGVIEPFPGPVAGARERGTDRHSGTTRGLEPAAALAPIHDVIGVRHGRPPFQKRANRQWRRSSGGRGSRLDWRKRHAASRRAIVAANSRRQPAIRTARLVGQSGRAARAGDVRSRPQARHGVTGRHREHRATTPA